MKKLISIIISLFMLYSCEDSGYSFSTCMDTLCNYYGSKIVGKYKVISNDRSKDIQDTMYLITIRTKRISYYEIKNVRVVKYEYDKAKVGTIINKDNV